MTNESLKPNAGGVWEFKVNYRKLKDQSKRNFDSRRGARLLPSLKENAWEFIPDMDRMGKVRKDSKCRRSVVLNTGLGQIRRKRQ